MKPIVCRDAKGSNICQASVALLECARESLVETFRGKLHVLVQQRCHESLHLLASQTDILLVGIS
jgi:hypothetical protein